MDGKDWRYYLEREDVARASAKAAPYNTGRDPVECADCEGDPRGCERCDYAGLLDLDDEDQRQHERDHAAGSL